MGGKLQLNVSMLEEATVMSLLLWSHDAAGPGANDLQNVLKTKF